MAEQAYRDFRRRALSSVARSVVRDPALEPPDEEGGTPVVRLRPAVREYLGAEFEDRLGHLAPQSLLAAVPVDPPEVESTGPVPLDDEADVAQGRRRAYRAVLLDLLAELSGHAEGLARAIEVHAALERLVGERGPPTDRRPSGVVSDFLEWVATTRGEAAAESLRGEFTVLHVMGIAPLYGVDDDGSSELAVTVREWIARAHPDALDGLGVTVER